MEPHTMSALSALTCQFLAELLKHTDDAPTPAVHRKRLRAFIEELQPWVDVADCPAPPRRVFTLFEELSVDEEDGETIWGTFTPEGLAFFRAWLRRRGIDPLLCSA
jgi:hypothetical protein